MISAKAFIDGFDLIRQSDLFDEQFYISQHPELEANGVSALLHFLETAGGDPQACFSIKFYQENYGYQMETWTNPLVHFLSHAENNPHPLFDCNYYLANNKDAVGDRNPLYHYLKWGSAEGRDPHPLFATSYYLRACAGAVGKNPLVYFLRFPAEFRDPHPLFQGDYYLSQLGETEGPVNALLHYLLEGERRGLKPNEFFDPVFYVSQNSDVAGASRSALTHFAEVGWKEGRDPSSAFSIREYMNQNRDIGPGVNPLVHYLLYGRKEGRRIQPVNKRSVVVSRSVRRLDEIYDAYERAETGPLYEAEEILELPELSTRIIAFYFPQFHPFKENDDFWGKGFTEWVNTTKAKPMFKGQYQPRLPGELGYYDTRVKAVIERQVEMAKDHGIHGFCLHHYFFDGRKVMRVPYNQILQNPDIDIKFCLHWANEPWTVRWDGLGDKGGVLLPQHHSREDNRKFFQDIEPALKDERYIRIEGRPLLVIYRPGLFPDMKQTIDLWRELAHKSGLEDLYLAVMHTSFEGRIDPRTYGFDAAIEYPPHNGNGVSVVDKVELFDAGFKGHIFSYPEMVKEFVARKEPDYRLFHGVLPDWDCTPRRRNPDIFVGSAPEVYEIWLARMLERSEKAPAKSECLIFVNAWNEWAEGAYLEPDRKYGFGYLNATSRALVQAGRRKKISSLKIAVVLHIYYTDLADEIISYLRNIPFRFDLYISTTKSARREIEHTFSNGVANASVTVVGVENTGMDVAPFLVEFQRRYSSYDIVCKIHGKKSPHWDDPDIWRRYLYENLIGSSEVVLQNLERFLGEGGLGVLFVEHFPSLKPFLGWGGNLELCRNLLERMSLEVPDESQLEYPSSTMFWFRPAALQRLFDLNLKLTDFEKGRQLDGSMAHAVERVIGLACKGAGYSWSKISHCPPGRKVNGLDAVLDRAGWPKIAVVSHIFYVDLLGEFINHFKNIPGKFDMFVSTRPEQVESVREALGRHFANCRVDVRGVENRGRDMAPFTVEFRDVYERYELICWTHSKKSTYDPTYRSWRTFMLNSILGSQHEVREIVCEFMDDPDLGLVFPEHYPPVAKRVEWGSNKGVVRMLLSRMGLSTVLGETVEFPSGSMFWFRPAALKPIFDLHLELADFEDKSENEIDGTLAHAIERLPVLVAEARGYGWKKVNFVKFEEH